MKVLLVWQEIPEHTRFFMLEGVAADIAVKAHGCYVNMVDGDPAGAAESLNAALEGIEPLDETNPIDLDGVSRMVTSDFMM